MCAERTSGRIARLPSPLSLINVGVLYIFLYISIFIFQLTWAINVGVSFIFFIFLLYFFLYISFFIFPLYFDSGRDDVTFSMHITTNLFKNLSFLYA